MDICIVERIKKIMRLDEFEIKHCFCGIPLLVCGQRVLILLHLLSYLKKCLGKFGIEVTAAG